MRSRLVHLPPPHPEGLSERWIGSEQSFGSLTDRLVAIPLGRPARGWIFAFGLAACVVGIGMVAVAYLLYAGVGIWGIDIPVAWGFAIINFVWWIGIGHAGTLISAILLLLRQRWRTSINRFAEAMTLFAVMNAGLFPLLHLGRLSWFYWILPYPNTFGLWPQWRSPLVWDMFAVMTYFTVSLLFWYQGLLPDLAAMRDAQTSRWKRILSGIFALGWRGSARHWQRYEMLYLLLAGIATPLVVSVHSIVSLDFAVGILPGWHTTVFPPFFVAGAIYSGFAMVLTLVIPVRAAYGLKDLVTVRHLDVMAKVMLVSGLIVGYGYVVEFFNAWFSGEEYEIAHLRHIFTGEYLPATVVMLSCNVLIPQLLWLRWFRTHPIPLFILSIIINIGMWTERFVIVVTPLYRDFLPSSWGWYTATIWDWLLFLGTLGLFLLLMLLFIRVVPMLSMFELRELLHKESGEEPRARPSSRRTGEPHHEAESRPAVELENLPGEALYAAAAEFTRPEDILRAARHARQAGYTRIEAYSPFPVEGLPKALGYRKTRIAGIVLLGGIIGSSSAFLMQWYSAVIAYPWNVAGRPLFSWPSFIPITFELGVLGAALFGFFGMLALNRLPRPYDPIMNAPGFERVSRDRFLLALERRDPLFERNDAIEFLGSLGPVRVSEVKE